MLFFCAITCTDESFTIRPEESEFNNVIALDYLKQMMLEYYLIQDANDLLTFVLAFPVV